MTQKEMKVYCGTCGEGFASDKEYLDHICKKTGFRAGSIEHLDATSNGRFSMISKAALKRGEEKKAKEKKQVKK